ncbi:hypothetical protein OAQ84_00705 [Bdellovibrionales bacterium]|nr:hypothetical protein [Bdellovibrionales bacterium]
MKTFICVVLISVVAIFLLSSCDNEKGVILTTPSRAAGSIIIASQDGSHLGVTRYGLDGGYEDFLTHYRDTISSYPRGLALGDNNSIMVLLDGEDRVEQLNFEGETALFYASNYLSGTLYDIVRGNDYYYVIESNRIERISLDGERTNPTYINTNLGSCSLSTPRHMIINSQGQLVVVQSGGGGDIHTYDISSDTASCVSSVAFSNAPVGLVEHSDGYLYVVTQSDDSIYRADPDGSNPVKIWVRDLAIINNPNVIVEHPDGTLLVGSNNTHSIEEIDTDGVRVGDESFIKDIFTRSIYDILIIEGSE